MGRKVQFDVLAVAKATGFDEADRKITHLSGTAEKSTSGLLVAAAALAPAMIPIAAAATAAGASFIALGATGLLAFQGIKKEMAAGTPTGRTFSASISTLKGNLATLERTAAGGVLTGFQKSVADLQPLIPLVNADTAQLSSKLGDIVSHIMPGLVALFHTANPLFLGFADDLDKGAAAFERWATSSTGATKFVAYAQAQLPKVEQTVLSLATTLGHLAQAFAPMGGVVLTELGALSKVINAIPIPVLKVAAPLILSLVIAMKGLAVAQLVAPKVASLNAALVTLGTTAGEIVGPLAVIVGTAYALNKASDQFQGKTFMHDVLDPHNADVLKAQSSGMDGLTTAYAALHGGVQGTAQQLLDWGSKAENAKVIADRFATSQKDLDKALRDLHDGLGLAASETGTLLGSQVKAGITIDGVTTSLDAQTTAAGLLKNALDRLNGAAVSVEDTQNQFLDTMDQLTASVKVNGKSIDQNSSKGRANREVLGSLIKAANDHAQAVANQTAKTHGLAAGLAAGVGDLRKHEGAIRKEAAALGLDKDQTDALIRALGKIPRNVVTAVNVRDKASAQLKTIKQNIAALKSKQIDITTYIKNVILPTVRTPSGSHDSRNPNARAVGGPVTGGRTYLVNELGQELFVDAAGRASPISGGRRLFTPSSSGTITTAAGFARLRADIAGVAKSLGSLGTLGAAAQKAVTAVGKILPGVGAVERGLNAENRALQAVAARRARVADALKAANQRLADARKLLAEKAASVAQGLLGGFDLSTFAGGGPTSPSAILAAATAFADRMVNFRAQIALLQKEGLNKTLLDQLIQQGPSAQADALAQATKGTIAALNAQYRRAGVTAAAIGGLDAKSLYGAGVAAARGIVAGLRSQEHALDKQMERLGRLLVRALNKALGIRSPSTVTALAGKFAVLGLVKGIDDNVHHAAAAAGRLGAAAVPGNGSYPGKMLGGGNNINITIQAGVIANPAEFRRLLIGELEQAFNAGQFVTGGAKAMR